jgi:hypothetical protein
MVCRDLFDIGVLLFPQVMPQFHPIEGALEMDQVHQHRGRLTRIGRQKVKCGGDTAGLTNGIRGDPMALVIALDRCTEPGARIDENVIATTVRVAVHQQVCQVDAVNDAIGGDVLDRAAQPGKRSEEFGLRAYILWPFWP